MPPKESGIPIFQCDSRLVLLVRSACVLLLVGRAWQHLFWDAPFRALLWSQATMEGVVKAVLGLDWEAYASNPTISDTIQGVIRGFGAFYLLAAVVAMVYPVDAKACGRRWLAGVLLCASLSLFFLGYLY